MIGSFLTRGLVMVLGYAYPAYECYKTVEMNKPDIEQLRFWCQYWILVAMLTVCERVGDAFISWVPMYSEAKLAFFIYLWCPKTKGTTYVYDSFFRPLVSEHETEIDRNLVELRIRAGDMAVLYWQKALSYGQTRIFDILQYVASQSTPPQPAQKRQEAARVQQTTLPDGRKRAATAVPAAEEQPSPSSSATSSENPDDVDKVNSSQAPIEGNSSATATKALKTTATQPLSETTKAATSNEKEVIVIDSEPSSTTENAKPPPQETAVEEERVVPRTRSRKTRATTNR